MFAEFDPSPSEDAIAAAAPKQPVRIKLRLGERVTASKPKDVLDPTQRLHKGPDGPQLDEEAALARAGEPPAFPTAAVIAHVRAADIILPQSLEARAARITEMYLKKLPAQEIADELELDVQFVRKQIRMIDEARQVAFQNAPELAEAVVETHFDVMKQTVEAVRQDDVILEALRTELMLDHQDMLEDRDMRQGEEPEYDDEGKPKRKKKLGMYPMKVDSYFKGREVQGKQLDRIATMLGLLGKHAQPTGNTVTQVNNTFQFTQDKLNDFANKFLQETNNSIAQIYEVPATAGAYDVSPETVDATAVAVELAPYSSPLDDLLGS